MPSGAESHRGCSCCGPAQLLTSLGGSCSSAGTVLVTVAQALLKALLVLQQPNTDVDQQPAA